MSHKRTHYAGGGGGGGKREGKRKMDCRAHQPPILKLLEDLMLNGLCIILIAE